MLFRSVFLACLFVAVWTDGSPWLVDLLASLFVALTIIPVLAYWFLKVPKAQEAFDAIVLGCGGMGSAAACELARRGRRVALLDLIEDWDGDGVLITHGTDTMAFTGAALDAALAGAGAGRSVVLTGSIITWSSGPTENARHACLPDLIS